MPDGSGAPGALESDDSAWESFVAGSAQPCYLQSTAWAAIKRPNGWSPVRVVASTGETPVAAQILVKRPRGVPWGFGYAPRGPVSPKPLDAAAVRAFTAELRRVARRHRLASVRIEPEAIKGSGIEEAFRAEGWHPAPHVQQIATRIVDIDRPDEEIWAGFHRKCRQSISKAERLGLRVSIGDESRLDDYYRIHAETMERVGIVPRAKSTFTDMWKELAPRGMAHLLFAELAETGEAVGTLFLISCGPRVADVYGGTTAQGLQMRANYLLKWEAMKHRGEWAHREYDLWGIPIGSIAQFKAMFGGEEVYYTGGWELPIDRVGSVVLAGAQSVREGYRRLRGVRRLEESDMGAA